MTDEEIDWLLAEVARLQDALIAICAHWDATYDGEPISPAECEAREKCYAALRSVDAAEPA